MSEKSDEDTSIYPPYNLQLWLEAGTIDGPNRNQAYDMHITLPREMRMGHTISTIGTPLSGPSPASPNIDELIQKRVKEQLEVQLGKIRAQSE
jgi:hypothetical protein